MSNQEHSIARVVLTATAALWVFLAAVGCGKATPTPVAPTPTETGEGLAIYLTDERILPAQLAALSHLELEEKPILSEGDILSYTWATHEMTLTEEAAERLQALHPPTQGRAFAVCVDGAPIYAGAFWPGYSSQSFDGVTIDPILVHPENPVAQIQLGYPGPDFFRGDDPRSDERIRLALAEAGKLR